MRVFLFLDNCEAGSKIELPAYRLNPSTMRERRKEALDRTLREARNAYASYVNTAALFACQKPAGRLVNNDELAFQTVHQVEELWMKLLAHTLIDIGSGLERTTAVSGSLRHFQRAHCLLRLMREQLAVLTTLSPAAYREIREGLGQGSGQESPGYQAVLSRARDLWPVFVTHWLDRGQRSLESVYGDSECPAFALAEALVELDVGLAEFRHAHLQLVDRTIGLASRSLKGLPAQDLARGVNRRCFEELWEVRARFVDSAGPADAASKAV